MNIKFSNSIYFTLVKWIMFLVLLPVIFFLVQGYYSTTKTINTSVSKSLQESSVVAKSFIINWFYYRQTDIKSWSKQKQNTTLFKKIVEGYQGYHGSLNEYLRSYEYVEKVYDTEFYLLELARDYDYIYDIFMIDNEGNIIYTIAKESDLGTNLYDGPYAKTKFAQSYKKTVKSGEIHFSDLEFYAPSGDIPAGFFTAPLIDDKGVRVGVFAIQIKLDRIYDFMQTFSDESKMFQRYLIGADGIYKSPVDGEKLFQDTFNVDVLNELEHDSHQSGLSKNTRYGSHEYVGHNEKPVIGVYNHLDILGVDWLVFTEVDKDLVHEEINSILLRDIALIFLLCIVILFAVIFLARYIVAPIRSLAQASMNIAQGERDIPVQADYKGEIGVLFRSFEQMLKSLQDRENDLIAQTSTAKKALRELDEQKYALDSHAIVAITNVKGEITFANQKFVEITGYSKEELLGKNFRILNSGKHGTQFWSAMFAEITKGNIWSAEVCNMSKQGEYFWVKLTIVPFKDENGKPKSYISIASNITEQKAAEEKLIYANKVAMESVEAKSTFLASMSHEIRTPMNGVIGMLGLLLKTPLNDTQRHLATLAQSSASALLNLINDILDFSKVEAGKLELEHLDFDIVEDLGILAESLGFKSQEKSVDLLLDTTYINRTLINGDPGRIKQILTNIIGNAIKFTHEGYILVRASLDMSDESDVRLIVKVSDTGIGIPPEKIGHLFESFSQVDASTTRKYGGTGLGLAIVKKLCNLMHGDITVTSNYGYGTEFTVNIRVAIPDNSIPIQPSFDTHGKKVLILDESEYTIDVLQGQLEFWGMEVEGCVSPNEAMKMLQEKKYDIMFIDMFLKEVDSYKLAYNIRDDFQYNDMKLVMMTSLKERGTALEFKEIGIDASFPKPATTNDLMQSINVLNEDAQAFADDDDLEEEEEFIHWEKTNILLVEDNKTNQLVALGMLEDIGLEADVANNGVEALQILNSNEKVYDIILMDCQMPELDGYDATRAIRNNEGGSGYNGIPIVAMTANAMEGDREKCERAGMDDYISKPINPEILKTTLIKWLIHG